MSLFSKQTENWKVEQGNHPAYIMEGHFYE